MRVSDEQVEERLSSARILVMDDEESNVRLVVRILANAGFPNVRGTTDPRTVTTMLADEPADLIVLDLMMPQRDGFAVMRDVGGLMSGGDFLPILVLTADVSSATKQRALSAGASDFLTKPFDAIEVVLRAKNLLRTRFLLRDLRDLNEVLEERVRDRTRELERLIGELDLLNKTKSEMVQILAHELFTPIASIQGTALTLARLGPDVSSEDLESLIAGTIRATDRLRRLVENLRVTASLDREGVAIQREPVIVAALLGGVAKEFASQSERLVLPAPSAELEDTIAVSQDLARRALSIVIENALDIASSDTQVQVGAFREAGGGMRFEVADRGPGLNEASLARLFDAFVQGEPSMTRSHEGLGIGLYLARRIMLLHGGEISGAARKGGGSVFTLRFPAADAVIEAS